MSKNHPEYFKTQDSIRYCDAELSAEWYKTLERNEQESKPSVPQITYDEKKRLAEERK